MPDRDVDLALQNGNVILIAEECVYPLADCERRCAIEIGAGHVIDIDDQRRQRFEPGEKRVVLQQFDEPCRRGDGLVGERIVARGGLDEMSMQRLEGLRNFAESVAQLGPFRRIGRVHGPSEESILVHKKHHASTVGWGRVT